MATIDRIRPAYTTWSPATAGIGVTEDETYIGRHRGRKIRRIALFAMFYKPRHLRPAHITD